MATSDKPLGLFIIPKPAYHECPRCGWLYDEGAAIIKLRLETLECYIAESDGELHTCSQCSLEIRSGSEYGVNIALFTTVEAAEARAHELGLLLLNDPVEFIRTVVVVGTEAASRTNFQ